LKKKIGKKIMMIKTKMRTRNGKTLPKEKGNFEVFFDLFILQT